MTSDVNGTVVGIQGIGVASGTPTGGAVLTYVAADSEWEARTAPASIYGIAFLPTGTFTLGVTGTQITLSQPSGGSFGGGASATIPISNVGVTGSNIVVTTAGTVEATAYATIFDTSLQAGTTSSNPVLYIYHNGVQLNQGYGLIGNASHVGISWTLSTSVLVSCNANDTFAMYVNNSESNNTHNVYYATLIVKNIG